MTNNDEQMAALREQADLKAAYLRPYCWLFAGRTSSHDYGVIVTKENDKRRTYRAHRLMYEALVGDIPDGLVLDHLCRVTRCINPKHLEAIPQSENVRRGAGITVFNSSKTHCSKGHELTPDNIYTHKFPERVCKTCKNNQQIAYRTKARSLA